MDIVKTLYLEPVIAKYLSIEVIGHSSIEIVGHLSFEQSEKSTSQS